MSKLVSSFVIVVAILLAALPAKVVATNTYTAAEVSTHSTSTDCWMIFDNNVYDLTAYLKSHDKYQDIRDWCGKDMTQDFMTKDGIGEDHKASSYTLLNAYLIGTLSTSATTTSTSNITSVTSTPTTTTETETETEDHVEGDEEYFVEIEGSEMKALSIAQVAKLWEIDAQVLLNEVVKALNLKGNYTVDSVLNDMRVEYKFSPAQIKDVAEAIRAGTLPVKETISVSTSTSANSLDSNPYDFFLPVILTFALYFGSQYLTKLKNARDEVVIPKQKFNFIWNSLMIISLIPSLLFGIYMIARYSFTDLAKVDFDFMYWHVEGSLVFSSIIIGHLISRLPLFIAQLKTTFAK